MSMTERRKKFSPMTRAERAGESPQDAKETRRAINRLMDKMDIRALQRLLWNAERIQ